jgi:hypothetical protein
MLLTVVAARTLNLTYQDVEEIVWTQQIEKEGQTKKLTNEELHNM